MHGFLRIYGARVCGVHLHSFPSLEVGDVVERIEALVRERTAV